MNKDKTNPHGQMPQIYSKKLANNNTLSIRSFHSNKSSNSTKTRSNISSTLNDMTTLLSLSFNLTNALLIKNMNDTITSSLMTINDPYKLLDCKGELDGYMNSYADVVDCKIQGSVLLKNVDWKLQEKLLGMTTTTKEMSMIGGKKEKECRDRDTASNKDTNANSNNNSLKEHNSIGEMKVMKLGKKEGTVRNNSNDNASKIPHGGRKEIKGNNNNVIKIAKINQRFHSPPNEKSSILNHNHSRQNTMDKDNSLKAKESRSPNAIKIKVYNTNASDKINEMTSKQPKNIVTLPNKPKQYIKSVSPKPASPTDMHKEISPRSNINKTSKNQSLVFTNDNNNKLKSSLGQCNYQYDSITCQPPQATIKSIPHQHPQAIKPNSNNSTLKPPRYVKLNLVNKIPLASSTNTTPTSPSHSNINRNVSHSKPTKPDIMNLSSDDINIDNDKEIKKTKIKERKGKGGKALNKSFDNYKHESSVFDIDNDIFKVIDNTQVIIQENTSKGREGNSLSKEQQKKITLEVIREQNEQSIISGEDGERISANFTQEAPTFAFDKANSNSNCDAYDRFSFHNKNLY